MLPRTTLMPCRATTFPITTVSYTVLDRLCASVVNWILLYIGGMDAYVQEFGAKKTHDEFYTNKKVRKAFNKYVRFIVSRYANEPGIIAWELANDARCASTLPASDQCNTNTLTQWHAETAKFIRSIDCNHLITSGYPLFFLLSDGALNSHSHHRVHGSLCPSCPKLFQLPPPPKTSPTPGSTHKRDGSYSASELGKRRVKSRASGASGDGVTIRGVWSACMHASRDLTPYHRIKSYFSRVKEADRRRRSLCVQRSFWCRQPRYFECPRYRLWYIPGLPRQCQLRVQRGSDQCPTSKQPVQQNIE